MDKNQIQSFERAALYEILASLYLKIPTIDVVKELPAILKEVSEVLPSLDFKPLIEEAQRTKHLVDEDDKNIKTIQQQYYNHFFIPSTHHYIPPYESAVTDAVKKDGGKNRRFKYGSLWSNSSYHVDMCYDFVGFNPWDLNIEEGLKQSKIPDHIGFELAFMAYLCGKEAVCEELLLEDQTDAKMQQTKDKWNKLQKQFLDEHLKKFIESYYKIAKEKFNPFYLETISILKSYIEFDLASRGI